MKYKICIDCKIEKSEEEYYEYKRYKKCKECVRKRNRAWNEANKDLVKVKNKRWQEENKELSKELKRSWYKRNKGRIKTKQLQSKSRYSRLTSQARTRKLEMKIPFEVYETIITVPCYYCKIPNIGTGGGLDRIDNDKGYLVDNVLSCCGDCNNIRGDSLTVEEMKVAMEAVLKYRAK
jgi:hypothetical protein